MTQTINIAAPITESPSIGTPAPVVVTENDFAKQLVDDLASVFFSDQDFTTVVLYYHSLLRSWETYNGIFDNFETRQDLGSAVEYINPNPQVQLNERVLKTKPVKGDKLRINGKVYQLHDHLSDGTGVVVISLMG